MRRNLSCLFAVLMSYVVLAEVQPSWQEIAEKAVREAAEKAAREKADAEAAAKATAEEAAKATAEEAVKAAVEKAAKDAAAAAAAAAAKTAAEEAAKALVDEKTAKEEEKAAKEEAKEVLRQIDTRIFRLVHASAVEVAEKLNTMWNGEFGQVWKVSKMAIPFEESNTIVVTAPRAILDACGKIVQGLDVEAQQVYIEARFVELGNSAAHHVGINWDFLKGIDIRATADAKYNSTTLGDGVENYAYSEGSGTTKKGATSYNLTGVARTASGVPTGKTSDGSITGFGGTLSVSQMAMTISALDSSGDTKQFSNPKIIVSSGKKATVDMTTKYPNVKISAKRTTGTSDSLDIASEMVPIPGEDKMMFAKEAFFSWGISLDVTPRVGTNGLINVSIVPTISDLVEWVDTAAGADSDSSTVSTKYPEIKVQRLITEFNLASGTTAVIGGLSKTVEVQEDTGIPVLRKIPWIGPRIFGWTERRKEQREIIVFVTVGLVDPHEVPPDAGLPKNAILGRQYTKGQKLEPGDRPEKNMEGFDSLDLRSMEEQAQDPLKTQKKEIFNFIDYMPFKKDTEYKKETK